MFHADLKGGMNLFREGTILGEYINFCEARGNPHTCTSKQSIYPPAGCSLSTGRGRKGKGRGTELVQGALLCGQGIGRRGRAEVENTSTFCVTRGTPLLTFYPPTECSLNTGR